MSRKRHQIARQSPSSVPNRRYRDIPSPLIASKKPYGVRSAQSPATSFHQSLSGLKLEFTAGSGMEKNAGRLLMV